MKYVEKSLGEAADISSGPNNPLLELTKMLSLTVALIITVYFGIGYLTQSIVKNISVENENKWLGSLSFQQSNISTPELSDELKAAQKILDQLVQHMGEPKLNYRLVELNDPTINAYAFPGGTIGITKGLLDESISNNSIAFVLAHELGHFKHRHHLKGFSKALTTGIIFSVLFAEQSNLDVTQQMITILDRRHSKLQEKESDEFATRLVFETFGTTEYIKHFFVVLEKRENRNSLANFLSTHPSSASRIKNLTRLSLELNSLY